MHIQPAELTWPDGLPFSSQFNDIYFSVDNGLAETDYVFLHANRLAERFAGLPANAGFTIAETGFGTGLNFLATWRLWRQSVRPDNWLHFVSTEKHPLTHADLQRALALWPELADYARQLLQSYPPLTAGWHRLFFPEARVTLTLLFGDANLLLPELNASVDAWFLDGFAPDKNPQLWQLELLTQVARLSRPGATLSTFTVAGSVRRALEAAGFAVSRYKGFGRKREMITATRLKTDALPSNWHSRPPAHDGDRNAIIIGAGIAGVSCARALARRGWQVTVIDQAAHPASAASGNPAAIIYPKLSTPALSAWHFQQQAYLWLLQLLQDEPVGEVWNPCGLLWLLAGNQAREGEKLKDHPWPASLVTQVDPAQATTLAGCPVPAACLYFPQAGYLKPQALCQRWLDHPNIATVWQQRVNRLEHHDGLWSAHNPEGQVLAQAPVVIVANALAARELTPAARLPLTPVRGQISRFAGTPGLAPLKKVLCYGGYLTPALPDEHCLGASFLPNNTDTDISADDHDHNTGLLQRFLPELAQALPPRSSWQGRAALRAQTSDYLPMVGGVPVYDDFCQRYQPLKTGIAVDSAPVHHPGLYVSIGHGSKGFCYAPLAAEIIAADLNGEPYPVAERVLQSLNPARFWLRQLKRKTGP